MKIKDYLNNIKEELQSAELELGKGHVTGRISENMYFAFQQIQLREQVCGKYLQNKNIAYAMSILKAKYFEIDINLNFHKAWQLLSIYEAKVQEGQMYDALDTYFAINESIQHIYRIYAVAAKVNKENIKVFDIQPFINIPANLGDLMAALHGVNMQAYSHMMFPTKKSTQTPSRLGIFQQFLSIKQDNNDESNLSIKSDSNGEASEKSPGQYRLF